jgi:hypothetical protein
MLKARKTQTSTPCRLTPSTTPPAPPNYQYASASLISRLAPVVASKSRSTSVTVRSRRLVHALLQKGLLARQLRGRLVAQLSGRVLWLAPLQQPDVSVRRVMSKLNDGRRGQTDAKKNIDTIACSLQFSSQVSLFLVL